MIPPDDRRFRIRDDVLSRRLDDETVLLDLGSGTYFGLNEVGAAIWDLLAAEASVGEMRERILESFEVEAEVVERDLARILRDLDGRGLIEALPNTPHVELTSPST